MTKEVSLKDHNTAPNLQGNNKALSGHQPQGAEAAWASEGGTGINLESSIAYSVEKTRATLQEHAKLQIRSKRRLPKLKHGRISRSRFYILLHATLPMYRST
jgi:predicted secreted Zn-dependent protease